MCVTGCGVHRYYLFLFFFTLFVCLFCFICSFKYLFVQFCTLEYIYIYLYISYNRVRACVPSSSLLACIILLIFFFFIFFFFLFFLYTIIIKRVLDLIPFLSAFSPLMYTSVILLSRARAQYSHVCMYDVCICVCVCVCIYICLYTSVCIRVYAYNVYLISRDVYPTPTTLCFLSLL